ncbi:hypothetical protein [Saccharothrix deserti]|uniref:hypothetical protein n=1 Tax=Saccharothrix deserti TaxID=2593674 RepID=UPI0013906FE2|nr:hypothetical protein [Saccharothrix deserti]
MEQDGRPVTSNLVGGDVLGPSVQAGVIRGGVHIHVGVPGPLRPRKRHGRATGQS